MQPGKAECGEGEEVRMSDVRSVITDVLSGLVFRAVRSVHDRGQYSASAPADIGDTVDYLVQIVEQEARLAVDKHTPRWVSVKERLPATDVHVLCVSTMPVGDAGATEHRAVLRRDEFDGEFVDDEMRNWPVTHWMPLPDRPCTTILLANDESDSEWLVDDLPRGGPSWMPLPEPPRETGDDDEVDQR